MALIPVADDQVAAVVTALEMRERPRLAPLPDTPLRLDRWRDPSPHAYRTLFARVGAPWLWYSRLVMDDARLSAILSRDDVEVHAVVDRTGIEVGMIEVSRPEPAVASLDFLGLVPELAGKGHGRWLMPRAMALCWQPGVACVRVHTCTLDHPAALAFYRRSGFVAVRRTIETFPDPRAIGALPVDAAPQIPFLGGSRR